MTVAQDLIEILRCPYCVSGATRKPGDNPGQLELVRDQWLVCQEPDCGRKYPIKEDIPVMLIDEGDKCIDTAVTDLPEPGPLVEPGAFSPTSTVEKTFEASGPDPRLLIGGFLLGLVIITGLVLWFRHREG
jgi:uncharacterized protein YbaR (Trm112 family)